ncbi:MAG: tryptophan-rich sensory protein [Candidatus Obscuribacterales bacterium]|nr:tryptophan-rich sensory protein [Candidatus Obscuribacterales bacterium]
MQSYSKISANPSISKQWRSLAVFLTIAFGIATIGSIITEGEIPHWYAMLDKPSFTPPGWVFAAAWSFLYSAMSVAMWRVWCRRHTKNIGNALTSYNCQLFLNCAWTIIFFGLHNPGFALVDIVLLQLANIATAIYFHRIDKIAGLLFIPYIAWISFAAVLNFYIWIAN